MNVYTGDSHHKSDTAADMRRKQAEDGYDIDFEVFQEVYAERL